MELLYVYIDKYRCFKEQEIIFSNKFNVEFNKSNMTLKISKNKDYINIYPNNIVGINAIVGKNSSGKTCLLDLLGERIYSRNRNDEIWTPEDNDPHENPMNRFLNPKIPKKPEVASSYFFIYYFGQDSEHNSLFVFEATNYIKDCKVLFENNEMKINTGIEEYFDGKGWASFVFLIDKDERFIYKGATNAYKLNNGVSIQDNSSIILFKHDFRNVFGYKEAMAENESKICIQRRNRGYKNILKYDQINFLIEQMNSKDTELYKNEEYYLTVEFYYNEFTRNEDYFSAFLEVVPTYKDLDLSSMNDYEKSTLNFIYGFICTLYKDFAFEDFTFKQEFAMTDYIVNSPEQSKKLKKDIEDIIEIIKTKNKNKNKNNFEEIKSFYYDVIDVISKKQGDRQEKITSEFKKSVYSFYDFLKDCYKNKIEFKAIKDGVKIKFKKESTIYNCKDFFDNCIDEVQKKYLDGEDSLMGLYVSTKIETLSDGEFTNLELYASIYEQIEYLMKNNKTKSYILLFDEIEREMHPEMCRELIFNLIKFLKKFKENNFQLILSTHSPFLVSDLRKENLICLRKTGQGDSEVVNDVV